MRLIVLLHQKREVAEAYKAYGTRAAVLVRPDGTIDSALAMGPDEIRSLVMRILQIGTPTASALLHLPETGQNGGKTRTAKPILRMGELVPALELRDLISTTIFL